MGLHQFAGTLRAGLEALLSPHRERGRGDDFANSTVVFANGRKRERPLDRDLDDNERQVAHTEPPAAAPTSAEPTRSKPDASEIEPVHVPNGTADRRSPAKRPRTGVPPRSLDRPAAKMTNTPSLPEALTPDPNAPPSTPTTGPKTLNRPFPSRSMFSPLPSSPAGFRTPVFTSRGDVAGPQAYRASSKLDTIARQRQIGRFWSRTQTPTSGRGAAQGTTPPAQTSQQTLPRSRSKPEVDEEILADQEKMRREAVEMEQRIADIEARSARPLPVENARDFEQRPATNADVLEMYRNNPNPLILQKQKKAAQTEAERVSEAHQRISRDARRYIALLEGHSKRIAEIEFELEKIRLEARRRDAATSDEISVQAVRDKAQKQFLEQELDTGTVDEDELPETATVLRSDDPKAPLLARAEKRVVELWEDTGSNQDRLVVDYKGMEVSVENFRRLAPESWLNDEIVNLYVTFVMERQARKEKSGKTSFPKCHVFNSFFYSKLYGVNNGVLSYRFENVRRWTKKFDILACDRIVVPINVANSHWVCAMIDLQSKSFEYFDSLGGMGAKVLDHLEHWLQDESKHKKSTELDTSEWTKIGHGDKVPQQQNCDDCGVFTCKFVDYLSRGADFDFSSDDIIYFRKRMAHELLVHYVD